LICQQLDALNRKKFCKILGMAKRKMNPNSLANLSREGRPSTYDEPKKLHRLTVTPTGWNGVQAVASKHGFSVSELLEKLGRELLVAIDSEELEEILDLQDALVAEANPENREHVPWEQVKKELRL